MVVADFGMSTFLLIGASASSAFSLAGALATLCSAGLCFLYTGLDAAEAEAPHHLKCGPALALLFIMIILAYKWKYLN